MARNKIKLSERARRERKDTHWDVKTVRERARERERERERERKNVRAKEKLVGDGEMWGSR